MCDMMRTVDGFGSSYRLTVTVDGGRFRFTVPVAVDGLRNINL